MALYRLSWEMVGINHLHKYSNADPRYYSNTTQIIPNSQIPDEDWHLVSTETADPWDQFKTLKSWEQQDKEFVRKVKLEKAVQETIWEEILGGVGNNG